MLADILPTAYEVGVLNARVQPGDTVVVVGAGPIGLSAITGALLYDRSHVIAIDLADARLDAAKRFGADHTFNNSQEGAVPCTFSGSPAGWEPTSSSRRSGCRPAFNSAPSWFARGAMWPISESTASPSPCTSSRCGHAT